MHDICPKILGFLYDNCPKNIFPIFWWGRAPLPPSLTQATRTCILTIQRHDRQSITQWSDGESHGNVFSERMIDRIVE